MSVPRSGSIPRGTILDFSTLSIPYQFHRLSLPYLVWWQSMILPLDLMVYFCNTLHKLRTWKKINTNGNQYFNDDAFTTRYNHHFYGNAVRHISRRIFKTETYLTSCNIHVHASPRICRYLVHEHEALASEANWKWSEVKVFGLFSLYEIWDKHCLCSLTTGADVNLYLELQLLHDYTSLCGNRFGEAMNELNSSYVKHFLLIKI